MKKSIYAGIALLTLLIVFTGCDDGTSSNTGTSSITLAEAEEGITEAFNQIDKAMSAADAETPPEGIESSTSTDGDNETVTITFTSVSYDGSEINGSVEMTEGEDYMAISMDLTVDSISVEGSLEVNVTTQSTDTFVGDITGSFNVSGGSISSFGYDMVITETYDSTTDVTGTITVNGKSFDADEFSEETYPFG